MTTRYTWRYVGHGGCADCADEWASLWAPELPGTHAILAARLCSSCRRRYDAGQVSPHRCPTCLLSLRPGRGGYKCPVCRDIGEDEKTASAGDD